MKEGYKDSPLGKIPKSWEVVKLGSLLDQIKGGGTPSKNIPQYWKPEIPWITVKDLKQPIVNKSIDFISKVGLDNSAANLIPAWTIIISTRMAVGKAIFFTKDVSINQDLKALFPKDNLSKFYLFHWFHFNSEYILSLASGSTVKGIRLEVLKDLKLALPTINVQEKIADILSTVDEKIELIDQQIAAYQELKKGLMQQLLTGQWSVLENRRLRPEEMKDSPLGKIPKNWEVVKLYDLRNKNDRYGFTGGPFGSDLKSEHYTKSGVKIIQLQNIGEGKFIDKGLTYTSEEKANELSSCNIYPGEIILAKMAPVARCCIIPPSDNRYLMCSDGIRLSVDTDKYDNEFVFQALNSNYFRAEAESKSTGTTRARIGLKELKLIPIKIPKNLSEQQKIADILRSVDDKLELLSEKKNTYQELKKGLMQQLLTGKVRVNGLIEQKATI